MFENCIEVCKLVEEKKLCRRSARTIREIAERNAELGYLFMSADLLGLNKKAIDNRELLYIQRFNTLQSLYNTQINILRNGKHKHTCICTDDTFLNTFVSYYRRFLNTNNKTISNLDLFTYEKQNIHISTYKKPKLFDGTLVVNNNTIEVHRSAELTKVRLYEKAYRYCIYKPSTLVKIDLTTLGFSGSFTLQDGICVKYTRNSNILLDKFLTTNLDSPIEIILPILIFFNVYPIDLLNKKIDAYIHKRISAIVLLNDLSFVAKHFNIYMLDISMLINYLEAAIITRDVEKETYLLLCLVSFLISTKQIYFNEALHSQLKHNKYTAKHNKKQKHPLDYLKASIMCFKTQSITLDPQYNFPIIKQPLIPYPIYTNISSNILYQIQAIISSHGVSRKALVLIFDIFYVYKTIDLPINSFFIQRLFSLFSGTETLSKIFYIKLGIHSEKDNYYTITKLFCDTLNDYLKHEIDVDPLFDAFYNTFSVEMWSLYGATTLFKVHQKRIKRSMKINELKNIKKSIERCDKTFNLKDNEAIQKLKEKAGKLLGIKQ